jgi:ribosomal protein S18 acetylase RimI-like enzyme
MTDRDLRPASDADRPEIVSTLAQAFAQDPVFRWMLPDGPVRLRRLPRLFDLLFGVERRRGLIVTAQDGGAASFWRRPGDAGAPPADVLRNALPLLGVFGGNIGRALAVSNAIEAHFPRDRRFWYAHFVGVRPDRQGKGWGGAMIRGGLARAAADGAPVYLETARPENVRFYVGLGFEVTAEWDIPRGPHFWSMIHAGGTRPA